VIWYVLKADIGRCIAWSVTRRLAVRQVATHTSHGVSDDALARVFHVSWMVLDEQQHSTTAQRHVARRQTRTTITYPMHLPTSLRFTWLSLLS